MDNFSFWEQYTTSCREMMECMMEQTVKQSDTFQRQMLNVWQPTGEITEIQDEEQAEQEQVEPPATAQRPQPVCPEPVWKFRGYQLEAGNFTNAMVHFFRAESLRGRRVAATAGHYHQLGRYYHRSHALSLLGPPRDYSQHVAGHTFFVYRSPPISLLRNVELSGAADGNGFSGGYAGASL